MTTLSKHDKTVRLAGLAAGIAIATLAVLGWRMPPGSGSLGLDLEVGLSPNAELAADHDGPIAARTGMRPGQAIAGESRVRNITGTRLALGVRALPSIPDLDSHLEVSVRAGDRLLYIGPLGGLRGRSPGEVELAPTETATLRVRAWLPHGTRDGWRGRIEDVWLNPVLRPVGGGR